MSENIEWHYMQLEFNSPWNGLKFNGIAISMKLDSIGSKLSWIDFEFNCELMYKILKICFSLSSFATMVLKKNEMIQIWKDSFSFQIHIRF